MLTNIILIFNNVKLVNTILRIPLIKFATNIFMMLFQNNIDNSVKYKLFKFIPNFPGWETTHKNYNVLTNSNALS